ncbi:hypothetical protein IPM19_02260 [bacterium]|nr:MAG: hypothetical protein IPM19_02260 [bacterium]
MKKNTVPSKVYCQVYLEADEFFGDKPDGFSLHLDKNNLDRYAAPFRIGNRGEATYTDGKPFQVETSSLPETLLKKLMHSQTGMVRVFKGQYRTPNPPPEACVQWQPTGNGSYGRRY